MVLAYSYSRFSSRAQAEGDSLRRQLSAAYAYAEANGLELDTSLQDLGVSAYSGDNRTKGALRSFLNKVESGEIPPGSFLLIDSMDRLSRQMVTQATHQLLGIALAGITVVTLSDGRKFDANASMADVMMAVIEIERSHRESAEKGRKVRAAHAESKRKAREEGRVWHRTGPSWCRFNEGTKRFDLIPEKADAVRRIFDLIEEGYGTTAIAKMFNDEGIEAPRAKLHGKGGWQHSAVLVTAKNPAVVGVYQPKIAVGGNRATRRPADGEPIEGYYPPVISREQFNRVQTLIAGRSPKRGNSSGNFVNLFVGLCRCNACGGTVGMHTASKHPKWKRSSVLQCVDSRRGLCEAKHRFKYEPLEAAILNHVREFVPPHLRGVDKMSEALMLAEAERDDLNRKVENLLNLMEDGDEGIKARYQARRTDLRRKEAQITDLRARLREGRKISPTEDRRQALDELLDKLATAEGGELLRVRAAVASSLRQVIDHIEFFGRPATKTAGGTEVREDYVLLHMVSDDDAIYMVTEDRVRRWGDGHGEDVWVEPERRFG